MNRRAFLVKTCGTIILLANPGVLTPSAGKTKVRFGLVSDIHYADRDTAGTRHYRHSITKLSDAIGIFNRSDAGFVIELGDFKDEDRPPHRSSTLTFLSEIENTLNQFRGPVYHVLGNHDMDSISKEDFLKNIRNHGQERSRNFYSFIDNGIKFIVLDANYNPDGSDYDSGNFDWTKSKIPAFQKKWLQDELKSDDLPAIVFIHQLLDSFSGVTEMVCVSNAAEIVEVLENNNVLAVFQGHHHQGHYSFRNGIHYFTMNAMVEGSLPGNNSFALVEIDASLNISIRGFYNCHNRIMGRGISV
jgi:predicted MPP superfamily phosphohydrolase